MKILAFDSSNISTSVAVLENDKILCEFFLDIGLFHSTTTAVLIDECLKKSNININDINLISCSIGPGSFTGIRIAMSILKGMALSLNIDCVGVSSLEAIANEIYDFDGLVYSIIEANKEEVYMAVFKNKNGIIERICEDSSLNKNDLIQNFIRDNNKVFFVGEIVNIKKIFKNIVGDDNLNFLFSDLKIRASNIGKIAYSKFLNNEFENPEKIIANYIKIPRAQMELLNKINKK